jgi:hypothetical protein
MAWLGSAVAVLSFRVASCAGLVRWDGRLTNSAPSIPARARLISAGHWT